MLTKITFDLADPAGILFFANVYPLAHKNIEHWLESEYKLWATWFSNDKFSVPIKHSQCEYFHPMYVGHDYNITSQVKKIGTTSIVLITEFKGLEGLLCARVETVHVFVGKNSMKKTNIPDEILEALN